MNQITRSTSETPREQLFQKDYSKQIDAAIEQLKQPINLSNPHACWLQLRQVILSKEISIVLERFSLALFDATSHGKTFRHDSCDESNQSETSTN